MIIGQHDLKKSILVIAEIGNNHEGNVETAIRMLRSAAEAGADAVKFQTFIPEDYVTFQDEARFANLKRFQLSFSDFSRIAQEAQNVGVLFLSTPFDLKSADFLNGLVPAFKVASSDIDFISLLDRLASFGKPLIVSAGTASDEDLLALKRRVSKAWSLIGVDPGLAVMHCISKYPTPDAEADLGRILQIRDKGFIPGYSDHTLGIDACVAGAVLGARIIEKHFTLDKNFSSFRDHQISADPKEFAELVARIRKSEDFLKPGVVPDGRESFKALRRSIAAGRVMAAGEILQWTDLTWVRPASGFAPGHEHELIGKKLLRSLRRGEIIRQEDLALI